MPVVQFKNVWEMYRIKFFQRRRTAWESFWALKDVSFSVEKGETLGIIGENGAGKSTVLKLIAGLLKSDRGQVGIEGRVSGLLELGAGFQPELTGEENIFLSGGLFGLNKKQIEERRDAIIRFAALGKFIHAPVKCYSQGMFVRLAFAIAVHVDPDILLIDDTLAVGDEYFQKKCVQKIFELKEQGKTILFVTHDINLLRQLCCRVLLFKEGRLIKDGPVDLVVSAFLQNIGEKKGIAGLQEGPLKIIFNNGRLFINFCDVLLTPGLGAHMVLRVDNKWVSSQEFDWEVASGGEGLWVLRGKLSSPALTQVWKISLRNSCIDWQVEVEGPRNFVVQEGCSNIMLTRGFTHWMTTLEQGEFLSQGQASWNWQAFLGNNIERKALGVKAETTSDTNLAPLIFQQSGLCHAQIFNSDDFLNCRLLQFKTTVFNENEDLGIVHRHIFSGKILCAVPEPEKFLRQIQEEFVLEKGALKCVFDNGRLMVSCKGVTLTKGDHASVSFFANGRWYSSTYAQWEFKKESATKLIARGFWHNLPLSQVWEIEILNESEFRVKVGLDLSQEVDIESQGMTFRCLSQYGYWFTDVDRGEFLNDFGEVFFDVVQRCICGGVVGLSAQGDSLPSCEIKFSKVLNNFAKIGNSDFSYSARELKIERVEPEGRMKFSRGFTPCFELSVAFKNEPIVFLKMRAEIVLDENKKIVFDNGCVRLFKKGKELTKKHAFYTSLRYKGRWHDSLLMAQWEILENNARFIRARGRWRELPMSQIWEISLDEQMRVFFNVRLILDQGLAFERLQTNLMLSEEYLKWQGLGAEGAFPDFRGDIDDDWDLIWTEDGAKEKCDRSIGVASGVDGALPPIVFSLDANNRNGCLNIVNSDLYFRGRILQYLTKNAAVLDMGEHSYFTGRIVFGDV
jgi:ABC-type polysaccharide/polyol phosphate transport system ATPase subunit